MARGSGSRSGGGIRGSSSGGRSSCSGSRRRRICFLHEPKYVALVVVVLVVAVVIYESRYGLIYTFEITYSIFARAAASVLYWLLRSLILYACRESLRPRLFPYKISLRLLSVVTTSSHQQSISKVW